MIPRECRRLAEVDFPIAAVSAHAAREKKIFGYHPQMLNQWWARRPLASCRAVLLGLLLPDPCDPRCPREFRERAAALLPRVTGSLQGADVHELPPESPRGSEGRAAGSEILRDRLLRFIADFANWDAAADLAFLEVGRGLVKAAWPEEPPLVVDPFAGGGSIPLEALRLGCETFASDLNPVACLILKVMLEDIPSHGPGLAEELRRVGAEIKREAEKELADLYPKDPEGAIPIAYLWARTVRCEAPNCGAEIPVVRSFWLCKKAHCKRALRYRVKRRDGEPPRVEFEVFEPKSEREVPDGTVSRARARCLACGSVLPPERVRAQLAAERGGADVMFDAEGRRTGGARLLAVVTLRPGERGRHYRLPTEADYAAVRRAQERLRGLLEEWERGGRQGFCPVPDEPLPPVGTLGFRVQRYGMLQWGDLFTARQKMALVTAVSSLRGQTEAERKALAFVATRLADKNASLVAWDPGRETVQHVFTRQALPILWDFVESSIPTGMDHLLGNAIDILVGVIKGLQIHQIPGQVVASDAASHALPDDTCDIWFTDPPYYDAVPYADLSDFFLVWLKRALPDLPLLRDPFDPTNPLSPKTREAVQDETKKDGGRPKDRAWFEETMAQAFAEGRRVLCEDGVGCVVFAHKTTEGWEALLSGLIRGGWTITGSWPVATERGARLRARESAALATSVHLICRPRPQDAPVGDWAEVLRELPRRVRSWMERLQSEGVRGADLVFACIGPALEVFSRYRRVETALGDEVGLPEFLEKVWEVVGRAALEQVLGTGDATAGALEEDARLTALFLWTLQSSEAPEGNGRAAVEENREDCEDTDEEEETARKPARGFTLPFDVVRRFAQPLGIALPTWENRIVETRKGVVRLLPVARRARALFGEDGAGAVAEWVESDPPANLQGMLFPEMEIKPTKKPRGRRGSIVGADADLQSPDATTLDRVHAAMLLQAGGRAHALRALIRREQERSPDFLRLANALSALYPRGSEEKRLLDAMLLAVPR